MLILIVLLSPRRNNNRGSKRNQNNKNGRQGNNRKQNRNNFGQKNKGSTNQKRKNQTPKKERIENFEIDFEIQNKQIPVANAGVCSEAALEACISACPAKIFAVCANACATSELIGCDSQKQ